MPSSCLSHGKGPTFHVHRRPAQPLPPAARASETGLQGDPDAEKLAAALTSAEKKAGQQAKEASHHLDGSGIMP